VAWVITLSSQSQRTNSLRQTLLAWLLPGVALLLVASGFSSYYIASINATEAYDRSLLNLALGLANQAQVHNGKLYFELQTQARQILLTDKYDEIRYAVYGPHGRLFSGEDGLFPERGYSAENFSDGHLFFDSVFKGKPVRGVILIAPVEGGELTVLVTETLAKREMQVGDILLSVLVPELILFAATIALVMHGVGAGLRPLESLRAQLSKRTPADLQPVGEEGVPIELRPLVREIDSLLDRLAAALDAQRHFVSDAAHQLRTPIAALQAQLESTRLEMNDVRLDVSLASVRRLIRLVNQLLALARAEPGGVLMEKVDLRALIESEAETWLRQAIDAGVDLGFELADVAVSGIPLLLREMIGNLVDNALRYTPPGGSVTVRLGGAGGVVFVVVEDSGPGIPPDQRAAVFERFFRGDRAGGGCGLGLAIVRRIADQHAADLELGESREGGVAFWVRFASASDSGQDFSAECDRGGSGG